jgi:hypothetical protein
MFCHEGMKELSLFARWEKVAVRGNGLNAMRNALCVLIGNGGDHVE